MVAAAAMAGVPLFNGFLSKEMFFAETIEAHDNSLVDQALPYIVTIASMFTVAYSLRFIRDVFFGPPPKDLPSTPHEPPFLMRLPAELLVLACLVVGIIPAMTVGPLLETAVRAVLGAAIPPYSLAVWHGFTPELLMSAIAIAGGVAVYSLLRSYLLVRDGPPLLRHINAQRIFERVLVAVSLRLARWLRNLLSTQRLQPQLHLLICAALLAGAAPIYARGIGSAGSVRTAFDFAFGIVWAVGIACAVAAAYQAKFHRLAALILLGGVGLVTCVSFVWLSAPDLALTQLLVEAVTTVLL
jgi:multicomponent K+:H+ antiporter subunit A